MDEVRAVSKAGSLGNVVRAQHDVLGGDSREQPGRRIQPQRLGEDALGLGQLRQVIPGRHLTGEDRIHLGVQPPHHGGMAAEEVDRPGEDRGRRLDPCQEQADDLVVELLRCQRAAIIANGHQHREQISVIDAGRAIGGDDLIDGGVQELEGAVVAKVARRRRQFSGCAPAPSCG